MAAPAMGLAEVLCAVGSGLLVSAAPGIFKRQGADPDRQLGLQLCGNALAAAACWVLVLGRRLPPGGAGYLGLGAVLGILTVVNAYTYLSVVLHRGPASISWAVVYLAAPLTAVGGWILLGEPVRMWQPVGMACFLMCLAAMALALRRGGAGSGSEMVPRPGYWPWLLVALLAGGSCGLIMKLAADMPGERHPLGLIGAGYVSGAAGLLAICAALRRKPALDRRTWVLSALYAAASVGALALYVRGLETSDAAAFAPVQAGTAVVFGTAWAVLRGERPSRLAYAGVALAILAIALFSLGGRPLLGQAPPGR
jgi:drug/metabolite transporter (DMT)-like permease